MKWLILVLALFCWAIWADTLPDEVIACGGANPCETVASAPLSGHFVDCLNGNDSQGGTTHATRWKTIGKVNTAVASGNVYFLNSTVCTDTSLTVDWSGVAASPVIIGPYYVSGGTPFAGLTNSGDILTPGVTNYGTRPELRGTYGAACRLASSSTVSACAYGTSGAVPSTTAGAMISITGSYVTVQDLYVNDAAAQGIQVASSVLVDRYAVIQRNVVRHTAGTGILINRAKYVVVRDNRVEHTNLNWVDGLASDWGSGIAAVTGYPIVTLIENNTLVNIWGENIGGAFRAGTTVVRGNKIANGRRLGIYSDRANPIVIEQNIVVAGMVNTLGAECKNTRCADDGPFFRAIAHGSEENGTVFSHTAVVRNNMVASAGGPCIYESHSATIVDGTGTVSGYNNGNTCVMPATATYFSQQDIPNSTRVGTLMHYNNFFAGGKAATNGDCRFISANNVFNYNFWRFIPSDTDCRGANDTVSATTGLGSFNFDAADASNFPAYSDFAVTAGTNAGTARVGVVSAINTTDFQWLHSQFVWTAGGANPSFANWTKELYADYLNTTRGASPDLGALEH